MERFTVATSSQLSGILEVWGLLLEAWESEEAELNILSNGSPTLASPTVLRARGGDGGAAAAAVPFLERWRRTYGRVAVLCAEQGIEQRTTATTTTMSRDASIPTSPSLDDSVLLNRSAAAPSSLSVSLSAPHSRRAGDVTPEHSSARSVASRRHVRISDEYYHPSDSPETTVIAHFFDVLLMRVVDLLMWRDPQLTACCLGILVVVYGYAAWASALCYLAGETLSSTLQYCAARHPHPQHSTSAFYWFAGESGWVSAERVWWGAPLFMISVLAYPWTTEQQGRVITLTDREHLRSIDHALRWLSATENAEDGATVTAPPEGHGDVDAKALASAVLMEVATCVGTALRTNRLPIGPLLLFNVIGAFSSWEAILVLFLWPMLIVGVCLAGVVVVAQCLENQ
ncbi:hypothetical protein ABB37_07313 [Leptomonas pyrrhocoris]|uniref:Uncharacterized protein n=1 Tax=Leptomonas pyrrhocoris TaxID=157538 RepID=A0A0N0DT57_LEPPY|nr:hypothetical protein ABB37_07313 [Leptomonas pyrrhocoris]KPA76934.1 hypothetical protein ABB37_07313 [Leptomonas pyrrhocoris]|eukprot:XP_015655373.1 hypothetical protein ABB37_07313 [Leptomonas pyrrhocoris]